MKKCYRIGCTNEPTELYADIKSTCFKDPVCTEHQFDPAAAEAKRSMEALQKLKFLCKQNRISYDAAKEFAQPHLKTWNTYAKARARKAGLSAPTLSWASFVR